MRFHRMTMALALLTATCAPGLAADNVGTLRTALSHIPETALATTDPMPIIYLDVQAFARAENGALSDAALRRLSLARMIRPLESLTYGMGSTWKEKSGVAFEDMSYFAGFGQPPANVSYWGLADANAANALLDALPARKFKEVATAPRMLANGEPRMIRFDMLEPDNPWLGDLGRSSFVIAADDAIVQASAPEDLKPIIEMKRSVADNLAVETVLQGLSDADSVKDTSIVQALVITPLFGLATVDASDLLLADPQDLEAVKKKIEARIADSSKGIPAYLGGMMADVQRKEGPALVVSLAYADCTTADLAVSTLLLRWRQSMDLGGLIAATGQTVATQNGACAAVVSFAANAGVNQPLLEAYGKYLNREFNLLQIGNPE